MLSIERKQAILNYVKNKKIASVNELARHFKVHEVTIRRDLTTLEDEKKLKRTHGGVMIEEKIISEPDFQKREEVQYEEKQRIASYASSLIEDGDTIILDSGTTTGHIARAIQARTKLTVITNDINVATILRHSSIKVIVTGGVLYPETYMLNGMITEETLRNLHVHKAFVTTPAIDLEKGLMHYDEYLVPAKVQMLHSATEVFLVTDHTKFGRISLYKYADFADISSIITGNELDSSLKDRFLEKDLIIHTT
ncbi:DeoR/GlpR transcriptional regulator [Listeria sp. SHR_NRA_18]|uniref:DeoR/GlpR family DNA-binding transcription regulator n=1 Tax=Listeria TaxID=1637 RepID=UPI00051DA55B|nr:MULTISPECIES: DeoR/GlpR family DNA-binding transcription regulator [Listeria]KGL46762.1 DeoR faimly transcriptional regulator [Listeriaceae bacterium FSL A5-0209]KMT62046.1 putative HTH-type transcriptional regulator YulB [Listeria newyorkensis]RQW65974.1 DeoR/GlpR transcriptional regulator [Listeria sp. SHR_NRA_18]